MFSSPLVDSSLIYWLQPCIQPDTIILIFIGYTPCHSRLGSRTSPSDWPCRPQQICDWLNLAHDHKTGNTSVVDVNTPEKKSLVWEMGAVAWEQDKRTALKIMATWNVIPHSTRRGRYAACSQTGRVCVCGHGLRPTIQQRLSGFDPRSPAELKRCCHTHSHLFFAWNMIITRLIKLTDIWSCSSQSS